MKTFYNRLYQNIGSFETKKEAEDFASLMTLQPNQEIKIRYYGRNDYAIELITNNDEVRSG